MTKSADRRKMGKLERRNTLIAYSFLAPNFIGFVSLIASRQMGAG